MAFGFRRFLNGIQFIPKTTSTASIAGDVDFNTTDNKLHLHNGTINSPLVTESTIPGLSPLTTKGDLLTRNSSTQVRLGVGIDGQILTADSSQAAGLSWSSQILLANNANTLIGITTLNTSTGAAAGSGLYAANSIPNSGMTVGMTSTTRSTIPNVGAITTFGATNGLVLETLDNTPIIFITNNSERMRILNTGQVGIGTTTPACIFDITQNNSGLTSIARINNTNSSTNSASAFQAVNDAGNSIYLGISSTTDAAISFITNDGASLLIGPSDSHSLLFQTNNTTKAFVPTSGGFAVTNGATVASNSTQGFLWAPSTTATPTGIPITRTGSQAIIIDETNSKLYFYSADSVWHQVSTTSIRAISTTSVTLSSTTDKTLLCDTTAAGGPIVVSFPAGQNGLEYIVKDSGNDASARNITFLANGTDTIESGSTISTNGGFKHFQFLTNKWWIVG